MSPCALAPPHKSVSSHQLHMRDTKPSEETSATVQISNVQYNETRRETAAESAEGNYGLCHPAMVRASGAGREQLS